MPDNISNWIRSLFGYQPYQAINNVTSSSNLPGGFPQDELVTPDQSRNLFNSQSINKFFKRILNWINYLIIRPIAILLIISFRILAKLINTIYFSDQYSRSRSLSNGFNQNNQNQDPIDKVNKFIRDLEDNLTPEQLQNEGTLPPFFQGSYTQALYMANNRAKFLFIYLTNPQNENSSITFQKIITNPEFISLFSKNQNIIIWGGDLTNPEAYQLANSLNITKFPFIGLLCLTRTMTMSPQGPVKTSPKISLIVKLQGGFSEDLDVSTLIQNKFKKKINKYEEELSFIRNELRDKFMSQVLLRQQDINYQNSLAKDRLKKQERLNEQLKKQFLAYKAQYFKVLKEQTNNEGKAKIAIKLLNGSRVTFYFPAENKVEDIFTFVELLNGGYLNEDSPTCDLSQEEATDKFKNYKLQYKFRLSSPVPPKTTLNDYLENQIKDIDCVYPNGLLIVEDI